jgi:hypothetical protein
MSSVHPEGLRGRFAGPERHMVQHGQDRQGAERLGYGRQRDLDRPAPPTRPDHLRPPIRCTVADTAYGTAPRSLDITADQTASERWDLANSGHWYDLTVTIADRPGWQRRLAGHVETGAPSISDPAATAPIRSFA